MKIAIAIFIMLHGVVHLIGPVKAFELADFNHSGAPISKSMGVLWFLTFVILVSTGVLAILNISPWWKFALTGSLLSQLLIIKYWKDAKYGTLANLLIALSLLFI